MIEKHLQTIGLMRKPQLDEHQQKLVDEKRAEFEARAKQTRRLRQVTLSGRRAAVQQVQHRRRGHDGRLHDLPELRRFEVRLACRGPQKSYCSFLNRSWKIRGPQIPFRACTS